MEPVFALVVGIAGCLCAVVLILGAALVRTLQLKQRSNDRPDVEFCIPQASAGCPPSIGTRELIQPESQTFLEGLGVAKPKRSYAFDEAAAAAADASGSLGKLNFGLGLHKDSLTLSVHIMQACNLQPVDDSGTVDGYVRACLLPDTTAKMTRVQKANNPKFDQTLSFQCMSQKKLQDMTLCLQVLDYHRFKWDDPIGEVLLPLKHIKISRSPVYWKNLSKCSFKKEGKGEVLASLCYAPDISRLNIGIVKARDLPAKDSNGSSDPYIKIWMIEDGQKIEKKKTSTKQCTLAPIFNETFSFDVSKDKLDHMQFMVTAMDRDMVTKNDEMGYIVFGKLGTESGRKHWKEMVEHPGYPSAQWHRLFPPKW